LGENAVIRTYKEKIGQPFSSVSNPTIVPKKQKKRRKSIREKSPKKETEDIESDDASPPTPIVTANDMVNMNIQTTSTAISQMMNPILHQVYTQNIPNIPLNSIQFVPPSPQQTYTQISSNVYSAPQMVQNNPNVSIISELMDDDLKRTGRKRKGEDNES